MLPWLIEPGKRTGENREFLHVTNMQMLVFILDPWDEGLILLVSPPDTVAKLLQINGDTLLLTYRACGVITYTAASDAPRRIVQDVRLPA